MRTLRLLPSQLVRLICATGVLLAMAQTGQAGTISWTDWTAATPGAPGSASGTLAYGGGSVAVTYSGEVRADFTQTSGGTNYWSPDTPYLSPTVSNAPPAADIITLVGPDVAFVNTITFSTPILDPVMAIVSLGQPGFSVFYEFDQPFTVLSFGPGFWGGPGTLTDIGGNVLEGVEGHGVIQFSGAVSSISWTVPVPEDWHGFTVGAPVPEPTTAGLLGLALAGLAAMRARRRSTRS